MIAWTILRPLLALLLLAAAATAAAQDKATENAPAGEQQIELTREMVEGFLDSYPELQAMREEFEREYGRVSTDPEDPTAAPLAYARYAEAKKRMEEILSRHGIASMEDWRRIAYSVMLAHSFAEVGSMDEEMSETIRQVEEDKDIPAEQKKKIVETLRMQVEQLSRMRPPAQNISLVAEYEDRIRTVIDASEPEEGPVQE